MRKIKRIIFLFLIFCVCFLVCNFEKNQIYAEKKSKNEMILKDKKTKIDIYSGPGDNYVKRGSINKDKIKSIIREDKGWYEVEYNNSIRGYIKKKMIDNVNTIRIPIAITKITQNVNNRNTILQINLDYKLTGDIDLYFAPKSNKLNKEGIKKGKTVKLINKEPGNFIVSYWQIEITTKKGKERAYVSERDLFNWDDPIRNFNDVKQKNALIIYNGEKYYSTTGAHIKGFLNNWKLDKKLNLHTYKWDIMGGITSFIVGNDSDISLQQNIYLPTLSAGKKNYHITYQNVDSNRAHIQSALNIFSLIFEGVPNFLSGAYSSLDLNVELQSYKNESKIVIRAGTPVDSNKYSGKTVGLNEIIVDFYGNSAILKSSEMEDQMIRSCFPELTGDKKYSMKLTFSKDCSDNPYGYYIIIGKDLKVYTQIIIHKGTSFVVYYDGKAILDAAFNISSYLGEVDESSANEILCLLEDNGFIFVDKVSNTYKNHRYTVIDESMTWDEAKEYCEKLGGHLVTITSLEEQQHVISLVNNTKNLYWIGLYRNETNNWNWVTNEIFNYSNWANGEPNQDFWNTEFYVQMYGMNYDKFKIGEWNDSRNNSGTMNFWMLNKVGLICEWDD